MYVQVSMRVAIFRAEDTYTYMQYIHHTDMIPTPHSDKILAHFQVGMCELCCMYVVVCACI